MKTSNMKASKICYLFAIMSIIIFAYDNSAKHYFIAIDIWIVAALVVEKLEKILDKLETTN